MKRIWIFALLAVLWLCIALSISMVTGDSIYLAWAIFLPPVLAILNALRPRRGIQYAYWNRYLAVFGIMLLGMFVVPIISGYVTLKLDTSINVFVMSWLIGWIMWIPGFILWFKFLFMPSWGSWRLRGRYPKMVAAASRLKKFGESYLWYFPLIVIQDRPYLVVAYNAQSLSGIATLDEEGQFVKDEALALTLLRCYKLAMAVLHMPDSQTRAQDIDSYRKTDRQVQQAFQHFRENEKNFLAAGRPAYELWKRICTLERYFHVITKNSIERKTWLAKWAFEHGLNRLTEVSDQQLYEVEGTLMKLNEILLNRAAELDQMGADAEALLKYLQGKSIHLEHRSKVEEMLKALVMLRQGITAWKKEATEFLPLESEWRAWQVRKMMAEKLEREGKL